MGKMLPRLIGEHIEFSFFARPQSCSSVKADPGQIEQVILNLVVNARDAMPWRRHSSRENPNTFSINAPSRNVRP